MADRLGKPVTAWLETRCVGCFTRSTVAVMVGAYYLIAVCDPERPEMTAAFVLACCCMAVDIRQAWTRVGRR